MELQPIEYYWLAAKKMTKFFVLDKYWRKCMLRSEEFLGEAASKLMRADQDWKPEYDTKITTLRSVYFKNHCRDFIRKASKNKTVSLEQDMKMYLLRTPTITKSLSDDLKESILMLPTRERECVEDYYFNNLTLQEIGDKLGVTRQRAQQIIKKAVVTLKQELV